MKIANFDKRNRFSYNWDNVFTCKMGKLIPYEIIPVLPGDTWRYKAIPLARMQALISPAFGTVTVRQHSFYVPNRIVWPKFYDGFMIPTQNANGTLTTATFPTITQTWTKGSLGDYLHYPLGVSFESSALEIRAYQKVVKDWFMNLQVEDETDITISDADGADSTTTQSLFNVNFPKDRFTGCFREKQRGPEIVLPLGTSAPVYGTTTSSAVRMQYADGTAGTMTLGAQGTNGTPNGNIFTTISGGSFKTTNGTIKFSPKSAYPTVADAPLYADLSEAVSVKPSEWRLAWQMNMKLLVDMKGGSRTPEWLLAHYGVRCSDARLQRSEFLGGSKSYFNVSEVLQTSSTDSTSPQGNMSGHGYCVYQSRPRTKTFEEHGYIVNVLSIVPKAMYMDGAPRETLKRTPEEFGLPVLSHTIMDAVYKGEVLWTGTSTDLQPLGYRNIYDEYRQKYSTVAGEFRDTLDYWTWARKFSSQPALNKSFIQVEDMTRQFATSSGDHFMVCVKNMAKAYRPLPKRGDPGLIDHR